MGKRKGKPDTASEPVVEPEETTSEPEPEETAPEPEPEETTSEPEPEEVTPESTPEEPEEPASDEKKRPVEWLRELGLLPAVISGVLMYHQHAPFCWRGTNTLVTKKEAEAGFERWKTRITGEILRIRMEREKKKKGGS